MVRLPGGRPLPAVRLGDEALVLAACAEGGRLGGGSELRRALLAPDLNELIELGPPVWGELRAALRGLIADRDLPDGARVPLAGCEVLRPVRITDYVDFYASEEHARNFGRIFRPGVPALAPNWHHLPVAYHGRASTVVVSGTPVRRPRGQVAAGRVAATERLDLECEVGFVCGPSSSGPIEIDDAEQHLFGVVLVNDWSARDIQRFEYVPLGPFLGKSFATSMSAWITPLAELADARTRPPEQEPRPAGYLQASEPWALDIDLEVELGGEVISRPNASKLYWTPAQMLAHMTVGGASVTAGDLFATGTVSGSEPGSEGSLAEIAGGRRWLQDGDEVVLRGRGGEVELGEVRGRVLPAAPRSG